MSKELVKVQEFISRHYNADELNELCFNLRVDYDELGEGGKTKKVEELLKLMGRDRQFDRLLSMLYETKSEPFKKAKLETDRAYLDKLYKQLPSLTPGEQRPRAERSLLNRVEEDWVKGVLERSLDEAPLVELGKEVRPDAVDYPWEMVVKAPETEPYTLPPDENIVDVFDDAHQSLLILGEPGSGKTTMLLDLARSTIARANEDVSEPMPVVLNLSSWTGQHLADWLIDELNQKYRIPKKDGRGWVKDDKLLLLLDGLDEVNPGRQSDCVNAIRFFRQEHLTGIAVCSRIKEFEDTGETLILDRAIFLQPLTSQQVDDYLVAGDTKLAAMRVALQEDVILEELAHSPLMLNIMTSAYQDLPVEALSSFDSIDARRRHIYEVYVQQMFQRRPTGGHYSQEQTIQWLSYLARSLTQHDETVFLIERIQSSWLTTHRQSWAYIIVSRFLSGLILGLLIGLCIGLFTLLFAALDNELQLPDDWLDVLATSLVAGATAGLAGLMIISLFDLMRFELYSKGEADKKSPRLQRVARSVLRHGQIVGLFPALAAAVIIGLTIDWTVGLTVAFLLWAMLGVRFSNQSVPDDISILNLSWTWASLLKQAALFLAIVLMLGMSIGLILGLVLSGDLSFEFIVDVASTVIILAVGLLALVALLPLNFEGLDFIQYYALRFILHRNGSIPSNYEYLLDYATERILMRHVGNGYIFVHRELLDYFASLQSGD
ncbi:MAG: NACHT domain-containing protein [Chloroflexota bacterium]|nr:MAG: NACHT domain-containing protein [Chloroflexota bacterium]